MKNKIREVLCDSVTIAFGIWLVILWPIHGTLIYFFDMDKTNLFIDFLFFISGVFAYGLTFICILIPTSHVIYEFAKILAEKCKGESE